MKLFGPLHEYVALAMVDALRDNVFPEHTAELLVATGADGRGVIVTDVVPAEPIHPAAEVAIAEYVPAAAEVAPVITGF